MQWSASLTQKLTLRSLVFAHPTCVGLDWELEPHPVQRRGCVFCA